MFLICCVRVQKLTYIEIDYKVLCKQTFKRPFSLIQNIYIKLTKDKVYLALDVLDKIKMQKFKN